MKRFKFIILTFGFALFLFGCEDFIEQDISKDVVLLLSPPDQFSTYTLTQTFWWEEIDGAEQYLLQIVKTDFSNIQQLLLDTTIITNKFTFAFTSPGKYQWRVKALNNGYETGYSTRSLNIDSTIDLGTQLVSLILPVENHATKDTVINFSWSSLYNATQYRFQLLDNSSSIILDTVLTSPQLTIELAEGTYSWKVRAENSLSVSPYSTRNIAIDLTSPTVPVPISPSNGDTSSAPVLLSWQHDPTAFGDSLVVFSDSLLTNVSLSVLSTTTSYSFNAPNSGIYFWRLKSFDQAGNKSEYSSIYKFYVQ